MEACYDALCAAAPAHSYAFVRGKMGADAGTQAPFKVGCALFIARSWTHAMMASVAGAWCSGYKLAVPHLPVAPLPPPLLPRCL